MWGRSRRARRKHGDGRRGPRTSSPAKLADLSMSASPSLAVLLLLVSGSDLPAKCFLCRSCAFGAELQCGANFVVRASASFTAVATMELWGRVH